MTDQNPDGGTPWCCTGLGFVSTCPLCPQYGTSLVDFCPGHEGSEENQTRVVEARLHAQFRHPDYEYRTTKGPRKQWDNPDQPPTDDNGEPEPGWEPNLDAGHPGEGWERFDYHEEAYWRRRKTPAEGADGRHSSPHTPDRQTDASDGENAAETGAESLAAVLAADLAEARNWARHGYEIGQKHCGWTDHGVVPAWLTEDWPPHIDSCEHLQRAAEYDTELARLRQGLADVITDMHGVTGARHWIAALDHILNPPQEQP